MDFSKKLNQVQRGLTAEQKEERKIINCFIFLMFGKDSDEPPKEFEVECCLDNDAVETFLREKLELDVRSVTLIPASIIVGMPRFKVELN